MANLTADNPLQTAEVHIDEWLDNHAPELTEGETYARWWFEQFRWEAWRKSLYQPIMSRFKLSCIYKGEPYRVTGCSRLGDVWLARDFNREFGYDHRVCVTDCTKWSEAI